MKEKGYLYTLTKDFKEEPSKECKTIPLEMGKATTIIRTELGKKEIKSDDENTVNFGVSVKLPQKLLK